MHVIALIGHHGVGKSTYAKAIVKNMEFVTETMHTSFANLPKKSVSEQFGIDLEDFYTDAKDNKFLTIEDMSPPVREILLRGDELKISYRELLIRWTAYEKKKHNNPSLYLDTFNKEIEEFESKGGKFVLIDDLRLFVEYRWLIKHSHEVRVLYRNDFTPPKYSELDDFDKEMTKLVELYGDKFKKVDITRK